PLRRAARGVLAHRQHRVAGRRAVPPRPRRVQPPGLHDDRRPRLRGRLRGHARDRRIQDRRGAGPWPCGLLQPEASATGGPSVKVVIPLAGMGTRLRPHTYVRPKPLLEVGGKPVMSYILDDLEDLGVQEIVFITGYLGEKVREYMAASYPRFRAHYVEQTALNGTAGAVKLAQPFIDEEVLIIFVDTLFDADLGLIRREAPDVAGIIWAKEVEDYQRFGVIVADEQGFMQRI